MAKYIFIILACVSYAAGDFIFNDTSRSKVFEENDVWETEIDKTITVKLKNKIEEHLQKRIEEKLEGIVEEILTRQLKGVHSCCKTDKPEPLAWIQTNPKDALALSDCAVVAGYEGYDKSPLWVIRARYEGHLIPGKLAVKHRSAFVAADGSENRVEDIEVLCIPPNKVRWVKCQGKIPPKAIKAGYTATGTPLYIGRAKEGKSLTPGKVHHDQKTLFLSFAGEEISHTRFEILCEV